MIRMAWNARDQNVYFETGYENPRPSLKYTFWIFQKPKALIFDNFKYLSNLASKQIYTWNSSLGALETIFAMIWYHSSQEPVGYTQNGMHGRNNMIKRHLTRLILTGQHQSKQQARTGLNSFANSNCSHWKTFCKRDLG